MIDDNGYFHLLQKMLVEAEKNNSLIEEEECYEKVFPFLLFWSLEGFATLLQSNIAFWNHKYIRFIVGFASIWAKITSKSVQTLALCYACSQHPLPLSNVVYGKYEQSYM